MTDADRPHESDDLRRRAEHAAEQAAREELPSPDELPEVLHELRVHQIELEMQNEALRDAQAELERSRDRYAELYDFAPVGYLTLDRQGAVVDANLTCVGIAEDKLAEIFEPFSQAEASLTSQTPGAVLGLSIALGLARRLGGDICARSTPGQGSTFTVTVAAEPLQRDGSPTAAESSTETAEISTLQLKGRVLLAEDDESIQALMQRALAAVGLEVDVAADGLVACEKALRARDRAMPYDVILMDIKMPRLDGFAAARRTPRRGLERPGPRPLGPCGAFGGRRVPRGRLRRLSAQADVAGGAGTTNRPALAGARPVSRDRPRHARWSVFR